MAKLTIKVNGEEYPCRQTMGAMLRFKEETGKEATEIDGSLSDMCAYLFCCVKSACKREGNEFDMSLMEFADSLTPEDITEWTESINGNTEDQEDADAEKKS